MKNFCPKTLHPKPYTLSLNFGFTLIELLVVVGIIVLLVGGGVAAYNNFNQNQILAQATATLRTNLRDAQNRALSGEKVCGPSACGGTNSTCGDEAAYHPTNNPTGEKQLDGWQVNFSAPRTYRLSGVCGSTIFSEVSFNLLTDLEFFFLPSPNPILFKSLTHGTNVSGSTAITLKHTGSGKTQSITVTASGEIK